jgi:class 3 adenylate cyclase/TolB-like protein/tetratricopeptide (TPR) repeat protein
MKRRMAAILVADVVGFSSLMEADEEGTAQRLAGCRNLIDAEVAKYDGRLFKAMGDAVLVEFASPINAVRCAAGIRTGLALAGQTAGSPLRMRFGLHLADVMVVDDDLIGDGVNLAARIQQEADADAIDISAALFEQIRRNSPFSFEDRGEQSFRNIVEPIRIFRLRGEIDRHVYQIAPTQPAPVQTKRPYSLAVMPIEAASGNEDQRFLADGITEEVIFELGRFKKLFVSSRSATRVLATSIDPQTVGSRLGVRYVLAGTIRQFGPDIRMSLTLSETDTGSVVWSDRLNDKFESLVDRLDELVSRIASTVLGRIEESDIAAARRLKPESMTSYEFYLRGLEYHRLGGVLDENLRQATGWFERAIAADPNFGRPRAMWVCARSGLPEFDWDDGERRTQRALELDPNDPEANRVMGSILMHRGAFDAARQYHEKAMALSPSDAYIKGRSAAFYNFAGEPERALRLLDEAGDLDPFLHVWCIEERVAVLYHLGRLREAIEAALSLTFQTRRSRLYRAAAHAALDESVRARDIVAEAIASVPDLTADYIETHEFYRDPAIKRALIERLVGAGLPRAARQLQQPQSPVAGLGSDRTSAP